MKMCQFASMSSSRRTQKQAPPTLANFVTEKMVISGSGWWPTIQEWQRKRFVSLRWGGAPDACWVRLTDAGRDALAASQAPAHAEAEDRHP